VSGIDVFLPRWGQAMAEATVLEWLKQPGEAVALDEPICLIETDKVNAEIVAPAAGVLGVPRVTIGATVPVGTLLVTVEPAESSR
jgi:2-oxoglutarate dehydrogenase E2 component (dihydrolipoamide succinyltransferase)